MTIKRTNDELKANRPTKEELIDDQINEFCSKKMVRRIDTQINGQVLNLKLPMIDISSSEIRRIIKEQGSYVEFLPQIVADYISSHRLYG